MGIAHNEYLDDEDEVINPESFAVHPGPFLKRYILNDRGITIATLAASMKVARPGLTNVINGKRPITTPLALKIERAIGYPAVILCQMQTTYDLMHDRVELEPEISAIERIPVAA